MEASKSSCCRIQSDTNNWIGIAASPLNRSPLSGLSPTGNCSFDYMTPIDFKFFFWSAVGLFALLIFHRFFFLVYICCAWASSHHITSHHTPRNSKSRAAFDPRLVMDLVVLLPLYWDMLRLDSTLECFSLAVSDVVVSEQDTTSRFFTRGESNLSS
jgi:hypothetical protein